MAETTVGSRLAHFPIPLFGSVMGLTGLAIALMRYEHIMHVSLGVGRPLLYAVTLWFLFLLAIYALKLLRYPGEVRAEFMHPVRMNFFPAISISMLLLAIGYEEVNHGISAVFWWIATPLHLVFLLRNLRFWFFEGVDIKSLNPAWYIPVVGTILVPIAGVNHASAEVSWFYFSIGIVYWVALLGVILNRVIFHTSIPPKLLPTLFILIAPPAVGFIAYVKLTGEVDIFARVLYYNGLFITLLLLTVMDKFVQTPFFLSWWAYTFPLDAATISTLLFYSKTGLVFFKVLTTLLLILTVLVIALVTWKTIRAAMRGEVCVPE